MRLKEDPRVQTAGMVARFFRFDPMTMLDSDYFGWATRVAAFEYAAQKEREAQEAASKKK